MCTLSRINTRLGSRLGKTSASALGGMVALSLLFALPSDAMAAKKNSQQEFLNALFSAVFNPSPPPKNNGNNNGNGNGNGSLPNGKPFQELADRIDRLAQQVRTQNAKIGELTEDLAEAEAAIEDLDEIVSAKCEEIEALQSDIVDLQAKDEELMAAIDDIGGDNGGFTQNELLAWLNDPLFAQMVSDSLAFGPVNAELDEISAIVETIAGCLVDSGICDLDPVAP